MTEEIILASASPRRRELLEQIHVPYRVVPSLKEESAGGETIEELVQNLARQKAEEVAGSNAHSGQLVLGADTIVVLDGQILGKPDSIDEAVAMLGRLQGRTHQVYTGVAFCRREETGKLDSYSFYEVTQVEVYPMTEEEIVAYASTGDGLDKAGAYGIQGPFAAYIKGIRGDYFNVVGLPVGRVWQELKKGGFSDRKKSQGGSIA